MAGGGRMLPSDLPAFYDANHLQVSVQYTAEDDYRSLPLNCSLALRNSVPDMAGLAQNGPVCLWRTACTRSFAQLSE